MLNYRNANIIFLVFFALLFLFGFFVKVEWYWFLVLFGIRFLILLVGSSLISSNFHVKAFCSNPHEREKKIAITFDDGRD
ncbi:hypothetical protein [Flavobacterium sp. 3HN19-14]|uniref:hypothetical protein n=1 Tax=Flavobacterium sp. 3HN19-14 TaxID=3448133 RepID=UPI003EE24F6E